MDETLAVIKTVLEFGLMGYLLYLNKLLWDAYQKSVQAHLDDLKVIAGLREQLLRDEKPFTFPTVGSEMTGPIEKHPKLP